MKYLLPLVLVLSMPKPLSPQIGDASRATGLFEKYKTSVVRLRVTGKNPKGEPADTINGTGFFITADGYLITAFHVVKKNSDWLQNPDGTVERTVEVSGIDAKNRPVLYAKNAALVQSSSSEDLDIAVLKTNVANARPVEFETSVSQIYSAAYGLCWEPDSQMPDAPVGTINTSDSSRAGDLMRLSNMLLHPANSGAPVFDSEGAVIGVAIGVNLNDRNVALARSTVQIRKLLPGGVKLRPSRAEPTTKVKVANNASDRDAKKERVYITATPVGWKTTPWGPNERVGTVIYELTVTGKIPARHVYLRELCVSPVPINKTIEPQSGREYLGDLVPGTTTRRCGVIIKSPVWDDVRYVGKLYWEDEEGAKSYQFCFETETARFVPEGHEYAELSPCDFKYDFKN
jgi:hypothetical protein